MKTKCFRLLLLAAAVVVTDNCYGWTVSSRGAKGAPCPPPASTFRPKIRQPQIIAQPRFIFTPAPQVNAQQERLEIERQIAKLHAAQQQQENASQQPSEPGTPEKLEKTADDQDSQLEITLPPAQRAALEATQQRAFSKMTPVQRQNWLKALNKVDKSQLTPAQKLALDLFKKQGYIAQKWR
jgi:hypothetical protein